MKPTSEKIVELSQALKIREEWKKQGESVVFTNGCFDILHLGHVDYLEKAKNAGQKMIVGLNTDQSVKKLKGPQRPINNQYARSRILASLAFVDLVILFDEDTPLELIQSLLPDVLIKGNDYTVDTIVGAKEVLANGGEVKTIELVPNYSTTELIKKIES